MECSRSESNRLLTKSVNNVGPCFHCRLQPQTITSTVAALLLFFVTFLDCPKGVHALFTLSEITDEQGATGLHTIPLWKQYVPMMKDGKVLAYKTAYFGHVSMGSPLTQTFTAVFDTGSGHLILPSTKCASDACTKHRRFNSTLSSSAIDIDSDANPIDASAKRDSLTISFGTGEVSGDLVQDVVCVGDNSSLCMKLRVVAATEMTPDPFSLFEFDGVVGLGLNALTLNPGFNFFGQLVEQNPKLVPQFAVFMALSSDEESMISFGGHDPELAQSEPKWTPVAMPELGYWQVRILTVRIGDETLEECADGTCRAILDTGTSLLGVPRQMGRDMHRRLTRFVPTERITEDTPWDKIDCRTVPGKSMEFELEGGVTISLGVEDFTRPAALRTDTGKAICRSVLMPTDFPAPVGPKTFIWGEPVLRRYYTVYDLEAKEIGFALARSQAGRSSPRAAKLREAPAAPADSLAVGAPLPNVDKKPRANLLAAEARLPQTALPQDTESISREAATSGKEPSLK